RFTGDCPHAPCTRSQEVPANWPPSAGQQLDNKINDFKHKQSSWSLPDLPAPKIVFSRPNGKKYHHPAPALAAGEQQQESFTPVHEENVRFVYDAWQEVVQQEQGPEEAPGAVHYEESTPNPHMDGFVPIDLDEWWAKRFLANIDKLS
uniref:Uncharacterized protein n=1 Tax=Gasterosteus aculeatus aculeatus TaxID=481459 RepID=G3PBP3_GASAC